MQICELFLFGQTESVDLIYKTTCKEWLEISEP